MMQRMLIFGIFAILMLSFGLELAAEDGGDAPVNQNDSANVSENDSQEVTSPGGGDATSAGGRSKLGLYSGNKVAVIRIEGMIYQYTLISLKRRAEKALNDGATVIVIELDTPGGMLDAALEISKYIKNLNVPTVAWVNNDAYSAGILIASACDEIVMASSAATGDCAPIQMGRNLAPTERDKILQPLLTEFRDSAEKNGYDYVLFHAMCEVGVEVYLIENLDTGDRKLVNQVDFQVMVKGEDPEAADKEAARVENAAGSYGAARLSVATEADRGRWKLIDRIADGRLLTLTQTEAERAGLSSATIDTRMELRTYLSAGSVVDVKAVPTAKLAYWLTQPWLRAILVIIMVIGAYFELQAPGLGFPGAIAALALIILLGAPFLIGLGEVWHVLLVLVGVLLFLIELFVTPGFAIMGIAGIVCIFGGLALMVVPSTKGGSLPAPEMQGLLINSFISMLFGLFGSAAGFFLLLKNIDKIPGLNDLVLKSQNSAAAAAVTGQQVHVSGDEVIAGGLLKVGDTGVALTPLHPTGRVDFDSHITDVVSLGEWIETGDSVVVVELHGNRIVVEKK